MVDRSHRRLPELVEALFVLVGRNDGLREFAAHARITADSSLHISGSRYMGCSHRFSGAEPRARMSTHAPEIAGSLRRSSPHWRSRSPSPSMAAARADLAGAQRRARAHLRAGRVQSGDCRPTRLGRRRRTLRGHRAFPVDSRGERHRRVRHRDRPAHRDRRRLRAEAGGGGGAASITAIPGRRLRAAACVTNSKKVLSQNPALLLVLDRAPRVAQAGRLGAASR